MKNIERALDKWLRLKTRLFTALLSSQFAKIGHGCRIQPPFRFSNLDGIVLGDDVQIHRDCWILAVKHTQDEGGPKLLIGSHASIGMGSTISAAKRIEIGEHVLTARNVYISDNSHAFSNVAEPIAIQGIDKPKPVSIGRHTWLGQNVCVLPGVTIGEHCVIGANSVVKHSIPGYSVAVGSPARVIKKYNFDTCLWESTK